MPATTACCLTGWPIVCRRRSVRASQVVICVSVTVTMRLPAATKEAPIKPSDPSGMVVSLRVATSQRWR